MKHNYYLVLSIFMSVILLTGCKNIDFKRTKSGLLYKIAKSGDSKNALAKPGNIIKLHFTEKLNDSVLQTTFGKMPVYTGIDTSAAVAYSPSEVLPLVRKGDSVVVVELIDSLAKRGMQLPPFAKKGDRFVYNIKIVDIFPNDSIARIDNVKEMAVEQQRQQKEMAGESEKERKEIEAYLATNKINTQKTPKGAYVQILNPGDGPQADSGKLVSVMYKGSNFSGKVFDTNMDSSFRHTDPLQFVIGTNTMIPGFDEGIRLLKKGGKGKIFIPAVLGFGPNATPTGKSFDNVIFDVEVIDVKEPPVPAKPK